VRSRVFLLPGLYDSGPDHWQSRWERSHPTFRRVVQRHWEAPDRGEWVATLDDAIAASGEPVVLAAHSLGCSLVAHWARACRGPVLGALLVAPADVESPDFPAGATGFAPMPMHRLPFPSIVAASSNDPYVSEARAEQFAAAWGARLERLGPAGHVNAEAGFGEWPRGLAYLRSL
jgi:serine hydrolase